MATPKLFSNICQSGILIACLSLHTPTVALTTSAESTRAAGPAAAAGPTPAPGTTAAPTRPNLQDADKTQFPWLSDRNRLLQEGKMTELVALLEHYAADPAVMGQPIAESWLTLHLGEAYGLADRPEEAKTQLKQANERLWHYRAPSEVLAIASYGLARAYRQTDSPLLSNNYYMQAISLAKRSQSEVSEKLAMAYTCELAEAHLEWHAPKAARTEINRCIFASASLHGNNSAETLYATSLLPRLAAEEEQEQERLSKDEQPVTMPNLTKRVEPTYPPLSLQLMQEGEVVLQVLIKEDGTIKTLAVSRSSGVAALDAAALEAVRLWEFEAGRGESGQAVEASLQIPFVFQLSYGNRRNPLLTRHKGMTGTTAAPTLPGSQPSGH